MGTVVLKKVKLEDADAEKAKQGEQIPLSRIKELEKKPEKG